MRRIFVVGLILIGLISGQSSCTLFQDESGGGDLYGLFIGIANYQSSSGLSELDTPVYDAQDLHDALAAFSHWSPARMTLILDSAATRDEIQAAIADLAVWSGADDTVLIYYSGHGVRRNAGSGELDGWHECIAPYDTVDSGGSYLNTISDDELESWLAAVPGREVVILDSCFSGGFIEIATDDRVVMAATSEDEPGFDDFPPPPAEPEHSVFTHFLLEGLAGSADVNSNGRISAWELFDYAEAETIAAAGQNPDLAGPAMVTLVAY